MTKKKKIEAPTDQQNPKFKRKIANQKATITNYIKNIQQVIMYPH